MIIANKLAKMGYTIAFITLSELKQEVKKSFDNIGESVVVQKCEQANILFLDNIGSENITKWSRDDLLFPILDTRINLNRPIFFTSNYKPSELEKRYTNADYKVQKTEHANSGSRIMGWIKEMTFPYRFEESKSKF